MSIDYEAGLMVGLSAGEIGVPEEFDMSTHDYLCEYLGLDYLSPTYDADPEDRFYGLFFNFDFDLYSEDGLEQLTTEIHNTASKFLSLTGKRGVIIVSPDIY